MVERAFRFGVVAGRVESRSQWTGFAKQVEDVGFDTLLMPDTVNVAAPFSALGSAAAVTTDLRLGTFVLATPLRPAAAIAWETASLGRLSDGRFELGLGAGRPDAAREAELFGLPFGTPGERVDQVAAAVRALGNDRPRIMIAAAGKRMLGLAGREADIVNLALPPASGEADVAATVERLREVAGSRFDQLELCYNTFAVGAVDALPPWAGIQPEQARNNKVLAVLTGSPGEIANVLLRRRAELGISYVAVNQYAMEAFAPVIDLLSGQ
ncbi:MAG TPA: LLM class flavin-dependent oxidoreductase [Pseudonocardiaceae bacterium]